MEKLPPIELTYNTSEGHKKVAEALYGMWNETLGVEIHLLNMEWKVFLSTVSKGDFSLARADGSETTLTRIHSFKCGEAVMV